MLALLNAPGPVVIIGTLWPDYYTAYCLTRVGVLRLVEPTAFRADAVRPAGRVADFLMPGGWR